MSDELYDSIDGDELLAAEDAALEPGPELDAALEASDAAEPESTVPASVQYADADLEPAAATPDAGSARYSHAQIRRTRDLLTRLYATRRAARFYPMDHPAVSEGVLAIFDVVGAYLDEGVDVSLAFFEGEILLGEQLLTEESVLFDQLVRDMTGIGVGSLVIRRGVSAEEISRAMQVLAGDFETIEMAGGLEQVVASLGLAHVEIGSAAVVERVDRTRTQTVEDAQAAYGGAVSLMREIDRLLQVNRHVSTTRVKGVVRSLVDNVLGNRYAMLQLTGLRNYDEYTFYHSANVAILSLALGSMVTTDYRFLSSLGVGALLHDIGKLSVDLDILNKPGALSPEEWANVRLHPVHGAEMVSLLPGVDKSAVVTILEHHMRYDTTGYPARTPARRQHLASRIVAVADSYDAMTSRRSYSAARVQDEAMAMLAKSGGSSLDPALVRLFVRLMGVYPPRSVVRLSAGEIGIVLQPSPADPLRPVVRIIAAPSGDFIDPVDVDLMQASEVKIRGCIDPQLLNIDVDAYI